jgi:hypothetical protein
VELAIYAASASEEPWPTLLDVEKWKRFGENSKELKAL